MLSPTRNQFAIMPFDDERLKRGARPDQLEDEAETMNRTVT